MKIEFWNFKEKRDKSERRGGKKRGEERREERETFILIHLYIRYGILRKFLGTLCGISLWGILCGELYAGNSGELCVELWGILMGAFWEILNRNPGAFRHV